jgi:transcriptional regulator with XRE-family HTH domain
MIGREDQGLGLVCGMDDGFLRRLAVAVLEARADFSQREFAEMLKVSQSTVQQWENGRNVPSLENLEKIARIKGMLVEDFVAYLYGRTGGITSRDILDRVEVMPSRDFAQVMRVMADRMDTAKDAPVIVERGRVEMAGEEEEGEEGEEGSGEGEPVLLALGLAADLATDEADGEWGEDR